MTRRTFLMSLATVFAGTVVAIAMPTAPVSQCPKLQALAGHCRMSGIQEDCLFDVLFQSDCMAYVKLGRTITEVKWRKTPDGPRPCICDRPACAGCVEIL